MADEQLQDWEEKGRAEGYLAAGDNYGEAPLFEDAGPSGRSVASMVLGILSLVSLVVCCGGGGAVGLVLAVASWILGHKELAEIAEGMSSPGGAGMAKAGLVMGIIGTVVNGLVLVGFILYVVFAVLLVAVGAAPPPP